MKVIRVFAALFLLFSTFQTINATDLVVTSGNTAGPGTLRDVIEVQANDNDTIQYDPTVDGTSLEGIIKFTKKNLMIIGNVSPEKTFITKPNSTVFDNPGGILFGIDDEGNGLQLENLVFKNLVNTTNNVFYGAGIVGLHSVDDKNVSLGTIKNVSFADNAVTVGDGLTGAGIIGTMSKSGKASMGNVNGIVFQNNHVTLTNNSGAEWGRIWGAGLIGAASENGIATVGNITNGDFRENTVHLATYLNGGGLIGVFSANNDSFLGNVSGNFIDNTVYSADNNSGGGIVGAWSGFTGVTSVTVGDIKGTFKGNQVTGKSSYLRGGGIVGLRTYQGTASLGTIQADFIDNEVVVGTHLSGGGIVGLYTGNTLPLLYHGNRDSDKSVTVDGIEGSSFLRNRITVGGAELDSVFALGGVVGVTGLDKEMTITDTIFQDNTLSVEAKTVHGLPGTVYVGTDRSSNNINGHVLTLEATADKTTSFRNNAVTITENGNTVTRYSSVTFGREYDSETGIMLDSKGDAILNIRPAAKGSVELYDPIAVDMNNGKRFDMNIDGTGGRFLWGGRNVVDAAGGTTVAFHDGSETTLLSDYTLTTNRLSAVETNPLFVSIDSQATITFDAARDPEATMFDFTNASNARQNGNFIVNSGAVLGVDTERQLLSIHAEYLVVDGAGADDVAAAATDIVAGNAISGFLVRNDNQLWVAVEYDSPYEAQMRRNVNTWSAREALSELVSLRDINGGFVVSDAQFAAIRENLLAVTPEYGMSRMQATMRSLRMIFDTVAYDYFNQPGDSKTSCDPCTPVCGTKTDYRTWGGYLGDFGRMDRHNGTESYKTTLHGLIVGADRKIGKTAAVGIYGGYMDERMRFRAIRSGVDSDGYQMGVLARKSIGRWNVLGDLGYGHFKNHGYRALDPFMASSTFKQDALSAGFGLERKFSYGKSTLTPFLRGRYVYAKQTGLAENGDTGLETALSGFSGDSFTTSLGAEWSHQIRRSGLVWHPRLSAAWVHEYADTRFGTTGSYSALPDNVFSTVSASEGRDRLELGGEIRVDFNHRLSGNLSYDFMVSEHTKFHAVSAGMQWAF